MDTMSLKVDRSGHTWQRLLMREQMISGVRLWTPDQVNSGISLVLQNSPVVELVVSPLDVWALRSRTGNISAHLPSWWVCFFPLGFWKWQHVADSVKSWARFGYIWLVSTVLCVCLFVCVSLVAGSVLVTMNQCASECERLCVPIICVPYVH